ncbi:major facilitator superfamily domain-containing protein [Ditylenchus destructor]|uniref:Major facilitator superfamily domain-containing protein n=1 Tax=Ditylenchus destructor TaxID=166010 RepID=A0AAD4R901_9BILA|nr:major facilitator superfamily domain-containing protein [Ditylenchus destructor]
MSKLSFATTKIVPDSTNCCNPHSSTEGAAPSYPRETTITSKTRKVYAVFGSSSRFVILAIALLCSTLVSSNSILLNFTIICMDTGSRAQLQRNTTSTGLAKTQYVYNSQQEGWLFSAAAIGGLVGVFPTPFLLSTFGLRYVFTTIGLLSGMVTFVMPFLTEIGDGFVAILIVRFIQGFAVGPLLPAIGQITHYWAPIDEYSLYLAVMTISSQLGIIFTMPVAGALCESQWTWTAAWFLHGGLSIVFFVIFFILYRNTPDKAWFITDKELNKIRMCEGNSESKYGSVNDLSAEEQKCNDITAKEGKTSKVRIPYSRILTDRAVWACLAGAVGSAIAYHFFVQYGPIYMNKVLNVSVARTGIVVAIPYVVAIGSKIFFGPVLDKLGIFPLRIRIVWMTFIAQAINVTCYATLGILPTASAMLSELLIITLQASNGVGFVGLIRNCQVIAQQHSHFIMALLALINNVIPFINPLVVSLIAPDNSPDQWSRMFFIIAVALVLLDISFVSLAQTKARAWTKE